MDSGDADVTLAPLSQRLRHGGEGGLKIEHADADTENVDALDRHEIPGDTIATALRKASQSSQPARKRTSIIAQVFPSSAYPGSPFSPRLPRQPRRRRVCINMK